jgi:hypothetical protein
MAIRKNKPSAIPVLSFKNRQIKQSLTIALSVFGCLRRESGVVDGSLLEKMAILKTGHEYGG